jgi:hypothetical protein
MKRAASLICSLFYSGEENKEKSFFEGFFEIHREGVSASPPALEMHEGIFGHPLG